MNSSNVNTARRSSSRIRRAPASSTPAAPLHPIATLSRGRKRRASAQTGPIKRRRNYVPIFPGLTGSPYFANPSQAKVKQSVKEDILMQDNSDLSDIDGTPEPPDSLTESLKEIISRNGRRGKEETRKDSAVESVDYLLQSDSGENEDEQRVERSKSDDADSTIHVAPWRTTFPIPDEQRQLEDRQLQSTVIKELQSLPDNRLDQELVDTSKAHSDEAYSIGNAIEMSIEQLEQFQEYAPDGLRRSRRTSRPVDYTTAGTMKPLEANEGESACPSVVVPQNIKNLTPKKAIPGNGHPRTSQSIRKSRTNQQKAVGLSRVIKLKLKLTPLSAPVPQIIPSSPHQQIQEIPQKPIVDLSAFKYQQSSTTRLQPNPPTPLKKPSLPQFSPLYALESTTSDEQLLQGVKSEAIELAKHLMQREPLGSKPEAAGKPLVWAETRQALTETLPYFKKPQGGCYSKDGHIYGFLLDGASHSREYMSANVVISRQGGGMGPDGKTFAQAKDHHISDAQATAFQNNIANQNPVVLIVGQRNTAAHIAVPHTFCVLDFYKPVSVWTEKTLGAGKKIKNTVRYRFERLGANGAVPWHARKGTMLDIDDAVAGTLSQASCTACQHTYPQIYLCGWICVNGDCANFWKLSGGQDAPVGMMLYNPAFLLDRTPWPRELPSWPLRPTLPDSGKTIGDNLLYVNSRGLCCPKCGRCTQRYKFSGWVCDNVECDFPGVTPQWSILESPQLHRPWDIISDGIPHTRNKHRADRGVALSIEYSGDWKISRYRFDGINGQLLHISPTQRINAMPGGADEMLAELQKCSFNNENTFSLERRRFKGNKGGGKATEQKTPQKSASKKLPLSTKSDRSEPDDNTTELDAADDDEQTYVEDGDFMGAFSINYGWPYKFIATGASESFDDAPKAIRASRSMLQWAANEFLGPAQDGHKDFNEELVFTYMQDQKLGYHDDGEYGLGPRIGTMTLGGPAQMNIRLKMKYFAGCSKETKIFTYERPLPKCYYAHDKDKSGWYQNSYRQRVTGFEELELLKSTDPQKFKIRCKEIPLEMGMHPHCRRHADDSVNLTLRHGDMIFMEGYDIQKYFEHGVQAEGFLRYALTCRKVLPGHLELKDHPKYEVRPDDYGYIGPSFED